MWILALLVCVLGCFGCQEDDTPQTLGTIESAETQSTQPTVAAPGERYRLTKEGFMTVFQLFDSKGNLIMEEKYPKEPEIIEVNENIIRFTYQAGTGLSTQWGYFYDYAQDRRSETFMWILDQTESNVILGDPDGIEIRSIFDDSYYEKVTDFKRPIAVATDGILSAMFISDDVVVATYLEADSYDRITEVVTGLDQQVQAGVHYLTGNIPSEDRISIQIPYTDRITGKEVELIQSFVRDKIETLSGENFDLSCCKESEDKDGDYSRYYIFLDAQITYTVENHVSVVFSGLYDLKGSAHPIHLQLALNYDPGTMQVISFDEKYRLDGDLYKTFAEIATANLKAENDGAWPDGWGSFSESLCSEEKFIEGMKNGTEFSWFCCKDGVVISYPVPYALGDHKEVKIPYESLDN